MGQCYDVRLKVSITDEQGATKALQNKILRGNEERTDYSLAHYREIGIGTDTLSDLLKVFFGGWEGNLKQNGEELESSFDCCYGWEGVMIDAFNEIAPFLADGSEIRIYPDSGVDKAVVKDGKAVWVA